MVKPKKYLGQHFLTDQGIAKQIVDSLTGHGHYETLVEIGPGTGVLTRQLWEKRWKLLLVEVDRESVEYLTKHFDVQEGQLLNMDFLKINLKDHIQGPFGVIGNFPYNISSQLFFKMLEDKNNVKEVVCMLQKEVAERLASPPGSKKYGILSVLLQAFYDIEYLFSVNPESFFPPPKVDSGVIRLTRNQTAALPCDEKAFVRIVKQSFQNRRKTLRNALKPLNLPAEVSADKLLSLRAEQLSVDDFIKLTVLAGHGGNHTI
ncbi:MAG: 16S rRNA (adenine(1518)-N(6)/adenine(1519)-N(6))-dimethyltransferase RsmA [Cyclobacteriaceae bacterium]|nr:16S rRNA (adenine(1518)-N(6)/adenine(1519)-N(6))-dimethyltransferase RsmA [Cyclobacteriaceae bacterium]